MTTLLFSEEEKKAFARLRVLKKGFELNPV